MRKTLLIAAVLGLASAPAMACEWMKSVSTPAPAAEEVVMTPIPAPPVEQDVATAGSETVPVAN